MERQGSQATRKRWNVNKEASINDTAVFENSIFAE